MKNYELTRQEKSDYCIPACLQGILRRYGHEISQEEIASNLDFGIEGEFFINGKNIERFFIDFGLKYFVFRYNEIPRNSINKFFDGNKDYFMLLNSHAELILSFSDPTLITLDPDDLSINERNINKIIQEMSENNKGHFGVVRKKLAPRLKKVK